MSDYKNGKWAKKIIELQKPDGSWGYFHSLSMPQSGQSITTEQAINRLRRLGFTKDDAVIKKALSYMRDCFKSKAIPDGKEKRMDFDIFLDLMLAVCIRKFTRDDVLANEVAGKWRCIVEAAFSSGKYDGDAYINTLYEVFEPKYGTVKRHKELLRIDYYYPISLLAGEIDSNIEKAYFDYIMSSETGYYYGYYGAITRLPSNFCSKEASLYLAAVELYCEYPNKYCKDKLKFVVEWLNNNKNASGRWDMGAIAKNGTYFPLSDSWRTSELREKDCTYRIQNLINAVSSP